MKVMRQLKNANILESARGPQGGYRISRSPEEVTLYEIVKVMEGDIFINKCTQDPNFCSRNATSYCEVHQLMHKLQKIVADTLKQYNVSEFLKSFHKE